MEASLNADDVARTFRILRKLDGESVKVLQKELRTELDPMDKAIAAQYPTAPVLSGFRQTYGRWGWGKVTGTVRVTPGKSRKGAGRKNVVSLSMNYKTATPFVVDMIGRHQGKLGNYNSARYQAPYGQGPALYRNLQGAFPAWPNGGRVFYKEFQDRWQTAYSASERIINRWADDVTKELARGY